MKTAFIYDAIRSPRGRANDKGGLHSLCAIDLVGQLLAAMQTRNNLPLEYVGDLILGCVTQYGEQAGNIAKAALMAKNWPSSIPGMTINRYCSSGLDAVNLAALKVASGQETITLAGGVEMMSRTKMLADKAAVFTDIETAHRCRMFMMGSGADLIASLYDVTREQADQIALQSQQRAAFAQKNNHFSSIIPISTGHSGSEVTQDECIRPSTTLSSLATLPPSFEQLGKMGVDATQLQSFPEIQSIHHIHTAGNSPAMADGASLVLLGDEATSSLLNKQPRARILATATCCDDPLLVISGCIAATRKLLQQCQLKVSDVDLFELHEAFAATMVKAKQDLNISDDKLNVNGGVIALGHPMGATGAIMLGTLLDELERRNLRRGIVAASGAAGTGTAILIERVI